MKLFICVLLGCLALTTTAQAASFDCTKASTKIEKMICGDAELSKFDNDLAMAYQRTLDQSDDKQKVIIEQRHWLKDIRNACKDELCLKQSYQSRLSQGNTFTEKCTTTPKLAFGNAHALVLTKSCVVWEWGLNPQGELGVKQPNVTNEPIKVAPLRNVVDVSASSDYSLAVLKDGRVVVWGIEYYFADTTPLNTASAWSLNLVSGVSEVIAVSAAPGHFLALRKDGKVLDLRGRPYTEILGLPKIVAISAASLGNLALDESGNVWEWLATPGQDSNSKPKRVIGLPSVRAIAKGLWHSMALDLDGNVWVWGSNDHGQLGILDIADMASPAKIPSISNITSIDANYDRSIALSADGRVYGWGGRWMIGSSKIPAERFGLHNIRLASSGGNSAGNFGTYAVSEGGELQVWKGNSMSGSGYPKDSTGTVTVVNFKNGTKPFNIYNRGM